YTWGRRAGLREEDTADLAQEVFLKLMEVLPKFQYDAHKGFRRWLQTVTLNTWRDLCKRRRPLAGNEEAVAAAAVPDGLEAFWAAEDSQHVVSRAITLMQADFQPTTWKAFWEQVVAGRPAREVPPNWASALALLTPPNSGSWTASARNWPECWSR